MMSRIRALVGVLLAGAALSQAPVIAWEVAKEGKFDGSWSVSGETYSMAFGDEADTVTIYRFTGPVLIRTETGFAPSLESECLGFSAPGTSAVGRCTLTDPEGDKIFGDLSAALSPGIANVGGRLLSGTGKYRGITGTIRFQAVTGPRSPGKSSSGQTMTIFGTWRFPA
jgi:hypothetical protein